MPGHGPEPGQQLLRGKGFGQVVVGPGVQAPHLILHLTFGGEHQHRDGVSLLTQAAQHLHPIHLGHHDVQDQGVVVPARQIIQRLAPVIDRVHRIVVPLQQGGHRPGKGPLILCQ